MLGIPSSPGPPPLLAAPAPCATSTTSSSATKYPSKSVLIRGFFPLYWKKGHGCETRWTFCCPCDIFWYLRDKLILWEPQRVSPPRYAPLLDVTHIQCGDWNEGRIGCFLQNVHCVGSSRFNSLRTSSPPCSTRSRLLWLCTAHEREQRIQCGKPRMVTVSAMRGCE